MKDTVETTLFDTDLEADSFVLIEDAEGIDAERDSLREFALGANLAHNLAYQNNPSLQTFKIKEADNVEREYQTLPIRSGHNAIKAEMYLPVNENDQSTIYVNFTGTCDLPSLHADLERNAGEQVFHRNKSHIMAQIGDAVRQVSERTGKPVTLHFAGHSLGGALAQHGMNETLRYLAKNLQNQTDDQALKTQILDADKKLVSEIKKNNSRTVNALSEETAEQFSNVNAVKISTWDATGVSKEVEDYSNEISSLLINHGHAIQARYGMIAGDFVQQTGQGTVLSDSDADVNVLKLDLGHEGFRSNLLKSFLTGAACVAAGFALGPFAAGVLGTAGFLARAAAPTLQAHTSPAGCFNSNNDLCRSEFEGIPYHKLHNNTPEGRAKVKARLQNKSGLLQFTPVVIGKSMLHGICKAGSRIGLPTAGKVVGSVLSSAGSLVTSPFRALFGKA